MFSPKNKKTEFNNNNNHNGLRLREKLDRWIWIILLVAAVVYFKYLLTWMQLEIASLTQERRAFQRQLEQIQKENIKFYQLQAAINDSLERLIKKPEP